MIFSIESFFNSFYTTKTPIHHKTLKKKFQYPQNILNYFWFPSLPTLLPVPIFFHCSPTISSSSSTFSSSHLLHSLLAICGVQYPLPVPLRRGYTLLLPFSECDIWSYPLCFSFFHFRPHPCNCARKMTNSKDRFLLS